MTSYTDKLGHTIGFAFDAAGRLVARTNREGEVVAYTYDVAGRLETATGLEVDRSFKYDPLGRVVRAENGDVVVARTYNEGGMTSETLSASGFSPVPQTFDVDDSGRVEAATGPWGAVSYDYDGRGRLRSVTDATLGSFTYSYNGSDEITSLLRPGGLLTTFERDDVGRPAWTSTDDALGHTLHSLHYTFDERGLPASKTDPYGLHVYGHDAAGRLISVDHPAQSHFGDESYTYDAASRRTSWQGNPAGDVEYDNGDRLQQDASWTYGYDEEGRRISKTLRDGDTGVASTWTYTWNGLTQLQSVTSPAGETWSFLYDAFDRRVRVVGPEGTQWFVFDDRLVRAVYDGEGELVERYVTGFGFGAVLARASGTGVSFAVRDMLGTPVGWVDVGGGVESGERDGFGLGASFGGNDAYGFTGHMEDSSGLVWGRARYLESSVGAWLSEDAAIAEQRYSYAAQRPDTRTDPDGNAMVSEDVFTRCTGGARAYLVASFVSASVDEILGRLDYQTGLPFTINFSLTVAPVALCIAYHRPRVAFLALTAFLPSPPTPEYPPEPGSPPQPPTRCSGHFTPSGKWFNEYCN